jgi:hypothetical protein
MHPAAAPCLFLDARKHHIGADNIERVSGVDIAHKAISTQNGRYGMNDAGIHECFPFLTLRF